MQGDEKKKAEKFPRSFPVQLTKNTDKRMKNLVLYFFLAVLAACLNAFAVGAPGSPGFLIFSPLPAAMRAFLALRFAYSPAGFFISSSLV